MYSGLDPQRLRKQRVCNERAQTGREPYACPRPGREQMGDRQRREKEAGVDYCVRHAERGAGARHEFRIGHAMPPRHANSRKRSSPPAPYAVLAEPGKIARTKHFSAMDFAEVTSLMSKLATRKGIAVRALEFTILTAARTGAVIGATWDESDLKMALWTVPASRMKAGVAHEVLLAQPVIDLLAALPRGVSGQLVFGSDVRSGRPIAHTSLRDTLAATGAVCHVHGFRSSFRTWAGERTSVAREIIEHCLAHVVGNAVERTYARTSDRTSPGVDGDVGRSR
jgi:integrase